MAGLYLHIPFCKQACFYCDFHFSTDKHHVGEMAEAMLREMELRKDFLTEPLETIYFGGGTPSLLPEGLLQSLLRKTSTLFQVAAQPEITLEANPDDLTSHKLEALRSAGINRLSIGIQSFRPDLLRYLNRAHDADMARRSLTASRAAGFKNISLDLMYALPGLTPGMWMETLTEALSFQPQHISAYGLTVENRTVFGNWLKKGKLQAVEEDVAAQQFEMLQDVLTTGGYEHYEISNFALPGFRSQHNSSYWLQKPYLGIGPSAHSYDGQRRFINVSSNALYTRALTEGRLPAEVEKLSTANKVNEFILTRLRTAWGCDLGTLRSEFHDDLRARCRPALERYLEQGLVTVSGDVLRLTKKGKLVADSVIEGLIMD
jgi:oxygen-independent coproporphyrinogen III oxidase